jgi:anti-sigma regulatory factor (Ser/Thr protein kinase)
MSESSIEVTLTNHLLDKLQSISPYQSDAINIWQKRVDEQTFNGHIVLTAPRPSGGVVILLGKFINDGLAAAVGVLPVGEVFHVMVQKGFTLSEILSELNKKLLFLLPEGMYFSACAIELEQDAKVLYVWNGGMPDVFVSDENKKLKFRATSIHQPLGASEKIDTNPVLFEVSTGYSVYCYAETGLNNNEAEINQNKNSHLEQALLTSEEPNLDEITASNSIHDLTVVKLLISELLHLDASADTDNRLPSFVPANWKMQFEFQASTLRNIEIVPMMINTLMQIQAPHQHKQRIFTVVTELFNNALDHGVLGLSSELKQTPNGFTEYYTQRASRLAALTNGYIKVSFNHEALSAGGRLTIHIEDSGDGFDYNSSETEDSDSHTFSGRGLTLLSQLCDKVSFLGKGNQTRIEYLWS